MSATERSNDESNVASDVERIVDRDVESIVDHDVESTVVDSDVARNGEGNNHDNEECTITTMALF